MNNIDRRRLGLAVLGMAVFLNTGRTPAMPIDAEAARPPNVLVLLGEWFGEGVLIGPRGGGPPPGDGYESAPIKELCDAVARELADKAVIEKTIRDNIGWALTKDRPLAESTMVRDESLFIINPTSESTIGWSQLVKNFDFWMDPRFKATKCEIWDMRIGVARSGDVAWWSCMLNDLAEWDGKPTGWKDARWTGVLEKRDGKWLIVQMHFSFAADKVAAQVKAKLEAEKAGPKRK